VWLERTISSKIAFKVCVKALIRFSLLETKEQGAGYAMHPVVQDWCIHLASTDKIVNSIQLNELALVSVGYTVPSAAVRYYAELQQRLVPHANYIRQRDFPGHDTAVWGAFDGLGGLYSFQRKLKDAEEMCQRALAGYEKALGPHYETHLPTLSTVNNLGLLYNDQGKFKEAEKMYQQALAGKEKALGPGHRSTLSTVNDLGLLYSRQGKLKDAEKMYQRALAGYEKALGPDQSTTRQLVDSSNALSL
jgi:tetratricopeptide (TPR) repeat protein